MDSGGADHGLLGPLRDLPLSAAAEALERAPGPVTITLGADHRLAFQNVVSRRLFGAGQLGAPLRRLWPESGPANWELWDRVYGTGATVEVSPHVLSVADTEGVHREMGWVLAPLLGEGGTVLGVVLMVVDTTEVARAEREAAEQRLLAAVSERVSAATDPTAAIQALADLLVPELADFVGVYVLGDGSGGAPPTVWAATPAIRALGDVPPPSGRDGPSPWDAPLAAGTTVTIPVNDETRPLIAPDGEARAWLAAAGAHQIAVVPLVAAGELLGALLLLAAGDRPAYGPAQLSLAEGLAARAGVAVAAARAGDQQRQAAEELQQALLPLPPVDRYGVSFAARYLAGTAGVAVGGDWWDVIDLGAGNIGLGIGDVAGRGVQAAALMGQVRVAMQTAALAGLPPAAVLGVLDGQLSDLLEREWRSREAPHRFATALFASLDTATGAMRIARAGHLPPVVRRASGAAEVLACPPGTPLGLGADGFSEVEEHLGVGDTLVLATDGLVERRGEDLAAGIERLRASVATGPAVGAAALADRLVAELVGGAPGDDVALLVAHRGARAVDG